MKERPFDIVFLGSDIKPPQAAKIKSLGRERWGKAIDLKWQVRTKEMSVE